MSRGYMFICFGKYYIDEAVNLVRLLRKFGDTNPVSILCGEPDLEYLNSFDLFDKKILFDFDNVYTKYDRTDFERFGGTPKILMMHYSPYDETIYTDTDMLVQSNTNGVWNALASLNQPYVATGCIGDPNDNLIQTIARNLNKPISEIHTIHSGIVYYNKKHEEFNHFSDRLKYYWQNYDEFGLNVRGFRGGRADEHAIIATMAELDYISIDPSRVPIITHNYHAEIPLPSNIVTGGGMYNVWVELNEPIPFIHMFKNHREHYDILYNRLINLAD